MTAEGSQETTGEGPKPTFDPLAPVDPSLTRELDQHLLDEALRQQARLRLIPQIWPPNPRRILGGMADIKKLTLRGETAYLRDRLRHSEPVADTGVVESERVDEEALVKFGHTALSGSPLTDEAWSLPGEDHMPVSERLKIAHEIEEGLQQIQD